MSGADRATPDQALPMRPFAANTLPFPASLHLGAQTRL